MFDRSERVDDEAGSQDLDNWLAALRERDCNVPRKNKYDTAMDVIQGPKTSGDDA